MTEEYTSLGLMSGTSGDGVDASIIRSDGETKYKVILDKYFKYNQDVYKNIHNLKDKINESKDLENLSKELESLEKDITLFHAKAVDEVIKESKSNIDFVGFHGQTIFHSAKEKISKQLGDGELLSRLTKKTVVYNFRENDLKNGGEGAPLAPVFHKLLVKQNKMNLPVTILNIGGVANITSINNNYEMISQDIGPGNCLIDRWIKLNSDKKYDDKGSIARSGKFEELHLAPFLDKYFNNPLSKKKSFDTNDFDNFITMPSDISLQDGAANLTEITAEVISRQIKKESIYICGGGRKNKYLIERIENKIGSKIKLIDELGLNGDFIESQAFAYLAIRSYLKLPISFPETTGCLRPCTGGAIVKAK